MSFYEGHMLQFYTANFLYVFNPFKIAVQLYLTASNFPILMAKMIVSQIQQAPGPDSRKVGKSLRNLIDFLSTFFYCVFFLYLEF